MRNMIFSAGLRGLFALVLGLFVTVGASAADFSESFGDASCSGDVFVAGRQQGRAVTLSGHFVDEHGKNPIQITYQHINGYFYNAVYRNLKCRRGRGIISMSMNDGWDYDGDYYLYFSGYDNDGSPFTITLYQRGNAYTGTGFVGNHRMSFYTTMTSKPIYR